ncbi:nuclear matrix constituent protein 1-like protein-like [Dorcoceras hygrometricum]|uniref:Nuclear matrix constituent protein 1-like protein-like n=1 Tax=Dorcoceras hygrometricum TaxID=472368 RepID=A0A2Z7B5Z2_9LAMI|nr:nuclear matrix constituent protein 1-like protein-like [Dorcoceras hygrometricum]
MVGSSSQTEKLAVTPRAPAAVALSPNPGSVRVLKTPLTDEVLWKRLKESGLDEESIKRRDKAALIAYIAKLEAELYEHQHHMGLLIMEKKEWLSKLDEAKSVAESTELKYKRLQASHVTDLAEAKKREDSMRKALGIEKECLKNIEKTLHELRAEYAELKVDAESKYAEAKNMVEAANNKLLEAEEKWRAAECLESEASRYHRIAERKLHEVEEREDDLRRRMTTLKSELDVKEKDIQHERLALSERQKVQQLTQERLLEGQGLLNQREEYVFTRTQELERLEKKLEDMKLRLEKDQRYLNEEKLALQSKASSISAREEAVIRRECDLLRKEEDLLLLQAKLASKESDNVQEVIFNHEATLQRKNSAFEAELVDKRKLMEDEMNAKRRVLELRELDLRQREDYTSERELELDNESKRLQEREKEVEERSTLVQEKEKNLLTAEEELESKKRALQLEKEQINQNMIDLQKSLDSLEEKRKIINDAEEKVKSTKSATNEFLTLELRLKEEIDTIRAQKQDLEAEADHLKEEKAKFEAEWELIDEKREELARQAKHIAEEKLIISKFLKDERDSLTAERTAMRDQYKQDLESLSRDREAFMSELEHERSEWFSKFQKERSDLLLEMELQKEELENCVSKRREEIESYLKEREMEIEEEKEKEVQHINSLKETVQKELEHVNSEMRRLDAERKEINLDREKRDQEWAELNNSIDELKVQREKLEKQRELLRADREEILAQIDSLKKLEDLRDRLDSIAEREMYLSTLQENIQKSSSFLIPQNGFALDQNVNIGNGFEHDIPKSLKSASPIAASFSWLKRCADTLLEQRPSNKKRRKEKDVTTELELEAATLCLSEKLSVPEMGNAVVPFDQTLVGAEKTSVCVDKIITIQEVTTTVAVERTIADSKVSEPVDSSDSSCSLVADHYLSYLDG